MSPELEAAIQQSHEERCTAQGHEMVNACSAVLQVYRYCKWCGARQ